MRMLMSAIPKQELLWEGASQERTMLQVLSSDAVSGCKRGRECVDDGWQHSERLFTREGACKFARCESESERTSNSQSEIETGGGGGNNSPASSDDGAEIQDPLQVLGEDIFQSHILTLLDARSLARCAAVSSQWRAFCLAEKLWQPLVAEFLAKRAHLPLCLVGRDLTGIGVKQHLLFGSVVAESRQEALVPAEMCGRVWELRLKPCCGPYWLGLDPTQVGKRGLNRYFTCDGRLNADSGDPIWGGHGCEWEFVRLEANSPTNLVRINHWPPLAARRVQDGRWVLENFYGLYITRPDNPAFSSSSSGPSSAASSFASPERPRFCSNSCTPPTYGLPIR